MKHTSRYVALSVLIIVLLVATRTLDFGRNSHASGKLNLPEQTSTHFFEIYHCGKLAGVVWVTPEEAALFRVKSLHSPELRSRVFDLRAVAREHGTAFAVDGRKGGCIDA